MYEYGHGGNAAYENGKADFLDLSANINPLGMPEGVGGAITRAIGSCAAYPDSSSGRLRGGLAQFESVRPDWIFCGGGASDIIFRLPKAANAKKVMVAAPSFSDYERAAASCGAEVSRYALSAAGGFSMDSGFVEAVRAEKPGMVFVCNPNNPTGKIADIRFLADLLDVCKDAGAYVAVDECFMDFVENAGRLTSKNLLAKYGNLIIIKAFTKLFAMPGLRLGYAICPDAEFIDRLYFHGPDWPVSALAQAAGLAALERAGDFIERTVGYVAAERAAVERGLARLGFTVFESKANYVFIRNPFAFDLCGELDKYGVRIRSCGNFCGLDDSYFRIAVSTSENNERLLSAVAGIKNGSQ